MITYDIPDDLGCPAVEAYFGRRGRIWSASQSSDPAIRKGNRVALWLLNLDPVARRFGLAAIAERAEGETISLAEFLD